MQDLVSVVIPVYNRESTIKRAVDSVLCQTYSNLEVIIVDDGSTDRTLKIISEYDDERVKVICQSKRGGANKARNIGIANSKGEYIAFQDSDDEWLPDKLRVQIEHMETQGYMACYSAYNYNRDGVILTVPFYNSNIDNYQTNLRKTLMKRNVIGTPTLMIRREVLKLIGDEYFDERMPRLQDYDFVIRVTKCVNIGYVSRPLVNAFKTSNSITTDRIALYKAISHMIKKHRDFLDVRQFLETFISSNDIMLDIDRVFIDGLDMIQKALDETVYNSINVKDVLIAYVAKQAKNQREMEQLQNEHCLGKLSDKRFSIYGAGKVGQELYYRLKARGLHPKCFLVTTSEKREYIDGIPVISIDENNNREDMVIIGISKEHQAELMQNLVHQNYKEFYAWQL